MLSLLSKQFASLSCGSSRQLISSVQKTRAATSVFGSINSAKNNYHTSSIYKAGRDPNVLTKEDSYDWAQLKQDVFKDFSYGIKKAPPVKKVTFIPEAEEDEKVEPRGEDAAAQAPAFELPSAGAVWNSPVPPAPRAVRVYEDGSTVAIGRRKRATAKVHLKKGSGNIVINGKHWMYYFPLPHVRDHMIQPLMVTERLNTYDLEITANGGGPSGQAGAIRLAIARALLNIDPELYPPLKLGNYLTRDAREVERKKPGRRKARRAFQWVKR
eukprot:TRINITY_DN1045_c0_g1_i1.p1 TRINITY_DN1045_c0_g1~~TRINITY_DN1045_c0_g1_i1.p1  ORF type:complete len:270 (-),score=52.36 TRINITY_DN1045_c0_g1_i1:172-981(-)